MPRRTACLLFSVSILFVVLSRITSPACAQERAAESIEDSVDRDYSPELPRLPALSAQEALSAFEVLPGFNIELVAAEPLVTDPVAFAFDARGRLFVVEMRDYSEQETERLGKVALLTDTDGDGVMDQRSEFVSGLSWPTACWPWRDGVLVAEPPRITWYRDTNGDGTSDQQEEWFTGFGRGNVQGLVNSLRWGVDGFIHGATSSAGADVRSATEKDRRMALGRRDFYIDPLAKTLYAESGGGQHGLSFNRWGDKFVTSNSDHLQQVIDLDAWLSRHGNAISMPSTRRSIAADGPQAEVFRASPVEPWRIVRTRLRVSGVAPGIVEGGGRAAGYFTGATGTWIVDGELGFSDGSETALVCDVGSNLVHRKRLTDRGLYWTGQRMDTGTELLRSTDTWFRPVQLGDGPDGAIYIADMVREVIEHPKSLPPMIKKHLDLTSGRERGRIWRLSLADSQTGSQPGDEDLSKLPNRDLVQLLEHPVPWQRRMASQLLVERGGLETQGMLAKMAVSFTRPESRIQALHLARRLGGFNKDLASRALQDPHPRVLEHALDLVGQVALAAEMTQELGEIADTDHPRVQLALAKLAAELDDQTKFALLAPLLLTAEDELVRSIIGTAAGEDSWKLFLAGSSDTLVQSELDPGNFSRWLELFVPVWAGQASSNPPLQDWLQSQLDPQNEQFPVWLDALCSLPRHSQAEAMLAVLKPGQRSAIVGSIETGLESQTLPTAWIGLLPEASQTRWLHRLLTAATAESVQRQLITSLAWADHPLLPEALVDRFKSMTPNLQQVALSVLTSRSEYLTHLAAALRDGRVLPTHIPANMRQRLTRDRNEEIAMDFKKILGAAAADRQQVINRYTPALLNDDAQDIELGRKAFQRVCATCHKIEAAGNDVGPPLKSLLNKTPEQLLETILDPNREVDPRYSSYSVLLDDGRVLAGIIRDESATQIVLAEAGGKVHRIRRSEIELLKSNGVSFMPVGLEEQLSPVEMAALIQYLRSSGR